jgi:diadenosine tetraphosphatase ApaH/serine/threonine PP2A family protein phosphatase
VQDHLVRLLAMLAVLYDIHGNLPALEAVLADARAAGADRFLLGGDYCAEGAWPLETLELLQALPAASSIRGNTDRALLGDDDVMGPDGPLVFAREALSRGQIEWLHGLPERLAFGGELFCHASPLSDEETFGPEPAPGDERLLAGEHRRVIVFGHSHVQFRREGPAQTVLVNPGSVGLPLDGDRRAAWGLRSPDGAIELRRTEYDVAPVIARLRAIGTEWAEQVARQIDSADGG